ncbi:Gfo/Idh/MocA family protein [Microbacterium sp. ZXX196]|uniref:Gfo/Idh/MocA family protein n=1 Tax=Microbacterium sp. ZXX196 TaxID=2609291 RepID=UPI0012B7131E|nr:Gfo/Idh/MocA family oxidoreductase [Microbacterium sp. ZXX196]MTE22799.1 gfo/Idh/MocA family oxidoreductase [Microbacterium sp. ZXX196]
MPLRRYALIGTGSRAQMYLAALANDYTDVAELVAWSDPNPGRLDWSAAAHPALGAPRRFDAARLADLVREEAVDVVIVTSPDHTHARYVVAALEAGADAVVEKPLTVDEEGIREIAAAAERTGRRVTITFNYRYSPRNSALKQVIAAGEIGEVTSVHFEWVLDTAHGADYFRRWHRQKENSGGLLIHKSSHHFDLVNWWIGDVPARVFASGGLRFYGADNAARRGLGSRPERGTTDDPARDAFSLDMRADDKLRGLYLDQEHHDGYVRDRDVFDAGITIEDNLALIVDYARGTTLSYALNAHSPWEGYTVAVNGTKGRAELTVVERGSVQVDEDGRTVVDPSARPDLVVGDAARPAGERLVVQNHFAPAREVPIPEGVGGHGGGDRVLLDDVFRGAGSDPLGRTADWTDGVRSVVVGVAGNLSLDRGLPVRVGDLEIGAASGAVSDARDER